MTSDSNVARHAGQSPAGGDRELNTVLRPAVDVFENDHSISLFADLPGVSEEGLNLEVDDKTLTIEGDIRIDMPSDIQSLHADIRSTRYRRAFTLSNELDTGKIEASLKDGVLTVTIPKREEVRPRKIEITGG
jgi:HSP20 family molecular chaperone IbpA